jgi:hypothetical protein
MKILGLEQNKDVKTFLNRNYLYLSFFLTGSFTLYKIFGFIGLGFIMFDLLLVIVLLSDMSNRVKINQKRIIY